MVFDEEMLLKHYFSLHERISELRKVLKKPLTLSEKILYSHLAESVTTVHKRGEDYVNFNPDRVAMQDATAQMALLQFMTAGQEKVAVPSTVHCDHLIQAHISAQTDLQSANETNREVYDFLRNVSNKYGIGFWKPGAGIIHQVILENYAFPGGMMLGTDSHTPNAGGLGMIAIGVGGADAVDVMTGMPWELKMPKIIGVKLTGKLSGWVSPKDVILKLAGILTVKGGTNSIIEYFGPGADTISATGKGTICNMGAEVGATTSIFPYDYKTYEYLVATDRKSIAEAAEKVKPDLIADPEVINNPAEYYDSIIEIDLSTLQPYVNGPFTPDAANMISELSEAAEKNKYPLEIEAALIGSCTNSSYEDLSRAASVIKAAKTKGLEVKSKLIINPGSEKVRYTAERDGLLKVFEEAGAVIMANACGPCIGQWKREMDDNQRPNSIITSFNRNFAKRNDGNPNTHTFISSPEMVAAMSLGGKLSFNPVKDYLTNINGEKVLLDEPKGFELPPAGFEVRDAGYEAPSEDGSEVEIIIDPASLRLQELKPFSEWDGDDYTDLGLLIKVKGKCTTDHISMAGSWLKFRGHLDNISNNLLMGAINYFNSEANTVLDKESGQYFKVAELARKYKSEGKGSVIIAEDNYGEGSSREHAAMEPRHLNAKVVIAKSFARIHETNLKKQGMLALTFANKDDYDKIKEEDIINVKGLVDFTPGKPLSVELKHSDGSIEDFVVEHTYNQLQIEWFKAGSALNYMKKKNK